MSKMIRQFLSIVLVLVLVVNILPLNAFASDEMDVGDAAQDNTSNDISSIGTASESNALEVDTEAAEVVEEDLSKRGEFYKEFLLSNGMRLAAIYPTSIHYEEDGQWKEIDNTLTAMVVNGRPAYSNTAGLWQVRFPQQLTGSNAISITKNGYTLSFGMAGEIRSAGDLAVASVGLTAEANLSNSFTLRTAEASVAQIQQMDIDSIKAVTEFEETVPDKLYSKLMYPTVYENTNVIYDLCGNQLKESIVLQAYDAALRGYRYELNTGGLVPVLNDDRSIHLCDPVTNDIVMSMPAPFMLDANQEFCDDVEVTLIQNGDTYLLSYHLPTQWLAEAERAWPVVLDPVVNANNDRTNIQDITVAQYDTESNNAPTIKCGYHLTKGILRTYLRYKNLPAFSSADVIVYASIQLTKPYDSTLPAPIEVHKVKTPWEASTTNWSNAPAFETSYIEDITTVQNPGTYQWDVTDIVRGWYADTSNALLSNTGMLFKATNAIETAGEKNWQQFCSSDFGSDRPVLTIQFLSANGLENYWDYTSSAAGRAGTGYVQNYSGNLVWVHSDIGFDGNRMPVSINHIYNAHDAWDEETGAGNNPFGMGNGWRTNFNQTITFSSSDGYIWEDGDGTRHEFTSISSGTKYKDKDDLGVTLTVSDNGYTLTDKYGNKSTFDSSGRLTSQTNNQSTTSSIQISYQSSSSNLISQILDGVNRKYTFTYSNGLLSQITYYGKGSTSLGYVKFSYTNTNLTSITYRDGDKAYFSYTTKNLMSSVTDVDGYKISYGYNTLESKKPSRVVSVNETDDGTTGSSMTIEYAYNRTKLTDHSQNTQTLFFNKWGNTISVQDSEGRATFRQYATDANELATRNRLRTASQQQNTVVNLLNDANFERSTVWTAQSSATSCTNTTAEAYCGTRSLKSVCENAYGVISASYGTFSVASGKSLTFSAYLKTLGSMVCLRIFDNAGATVDSEQLPNSSDWTRREVTYTNTSSAARTVTVCLYHVTPGTAYMDCVQLESSKAASRFNLIYNGDFSIGSLNSTSSGWSIYGDNSKKPTLSSGQTAPTLTSNRVCINGDTGGRQYVYQDVALSGGAGDTYVFSGWVMGDSLPNIGGNRFYGLKLIVTYTNGTSTTKTVTANPHLGTGGTWQYLAASVTTERAYSKITLRAEYSYNANSVNFDGLQLYREEFGETYTYDSEGNVTQEKDVLGQKTTYTYNSKNDLTQTLLPSGVKIVNTYDNYHNQTRSVEQFTNSSGSTVTLASHVYTYDAYGNLLKQSETINGVEKNTSFAYSSDYNQLASVTDELGNKTTYGYNLNTSVLNWVQYPKNTSTTRTNYTYDSMYRLTGSSTVTDQGTTMSAGYTYTDDMLTKITTPSTVYNIAYGNFALRTGVSIGGTALATYTYTNDKNHYLKSLAYGNGDVVEYTYDDQGRVTQEKYYENGSTTVSRTITYQYDNKGALAAMVDSGTGVTTRFSHDTFGRITMQRTSGSNHSLEYTYDALGRLQTSSEWDAGAVSKTVYSYDGKGRPFSVANGNTMEAYTYDAYDRLYRRYTYLNSALVLTEVTSYQQPDDRSTSNRVAVWSCYSEKGYSATYNFTYDANGNITSIKEGSYTTSYVYDSANQLIRENNQKAGKTWVWTYDGAGNILSKKEYAYTTGTLGTASSTVNYTYGNSAWGDLLTAYNGASITYDSVGNPLSAGIWTYTWKQGRQLGAMSKSGTTWTFTYDANGMRTKRTNGSTTYTYVYNGGQLSRMTCGSTTLRFTYGADGSPLTVTYNGSTYHYALNLQGDVVAILNDEGGQVVGYTYDAWGRLLSTSGSMASTLGQINPLRYRGYVYDQETGLYYLQSRYYQPAIGRFINADSLISQESALGNNMFAYCFNNPISYADSTGNFPLLIIAAALLFTPVGGSALQVVTSIVSYAGMAVASIFDEDIRSDMNAIGWNPFNSDETATLKSNKVSFYKGVPVFRTAAGGRSGSFGAIFLVQDAEIDTLRHERGHNWQLMMMGIANFGLSIGLPSWREWSNRPYYERPWEITADVLGGVAGRTHTLENINRGYWYLGVSALLGPVSYLFLFGEY